MFGEHNWVNRKYHLDSGACFWTHRHVVPANLTSKICRHGGKLLWHKEDATRNNQMGFKMLGKPHM